MSWREKCIDNNLETLASKVRACADNMRRLLPDDTTAATRAGELLAQNQAGADAVDIDEMIGGTRGHNHVLFSSFAPFSAGPASCGPQPA
jgi:hypothetical protein